MLCSYGQSIFHLKTIPIMKFKKYPILEEDQYDNETNPSTNQKIDVSLKDVPKDRNAENGEEEDPLEDMVNKKIQDHKDFIFSISSNIEGSLELLDKTSEDMSNEANFNGNFTDFKDAIEIIRKFKKALDKEIESEFGDEN
jgi:hypothetical protein